jgi:AraC-like DNA-binding protein
LLDPLAQIVTLLQPSAPFSKRVSGAGPWRVCHAQLERPYYCAILEGACRLASRDQAEILLHAGDFVLIPAVSGFEMSSLTPAGPQDLVETPVLLADGEFRVGTVAATPDVRFLVGYCAFASPDMPLLASLLPSLIHIRGEKRLATLVQLLIDENRAQRPAREVILARLLEVLLIETLRASAEISPAPGLLRGLADERLVQAIRCMHDSPAEPWTVAELAQAAALSRSAFYERFRRVVGLTPMAYLLAWRMALAKDLLRRREAGIAEIAVQVGYSSASTFTVAFTRHVGQSPASYVRMSPPGRFASPNVWPD